MFLRTLGKLCLGCLGLAAQEPRPEGATLQRTERRVALVMGNGQYANTPLVHAAWEARGVESHLQELGFEVEVVSEVDFAAAEASIARFVQRLGPDAVGLFYFVGHGLQVEGENFLLPIGGSGMLSVQKLCERLREGHPRLAILVLDACREHRLSPESGTAGLAKMAAPPGCFVAFSAAPGTTTDDFPDGTTGRFTHAFEAALNRPSLGLDGVFTRIGEDVAAASGGRQQPWTTSSTTVDFIFMDLPAQIRHVANKKAFQISALMGLQHGVQPKNAAEKQVKAQKEAEVQEQIRRLELELASLWKKVRN